MVLSVEKEKLRDTKRDRAMIYEQPKWVVWYQHRMLFSKIMHAYLGGETIIKKNQKVHV